MWDWDWERVRWENSLYERSPRKIEQESYEDIPIPPIYRNIWKERPS
jgi:hypothetical protein